VIVQQFLRPHTDLSEKTLTIALGAAFALRGDMNPKANELRKRTHEFFMRVIRLCEQLPRSESATSISGQLLDSSGSTDSNYRAACRARTRKEFIAKLGTTVEEADESLGWLESLRDAGLGPREEVLSLVKEANELVSIFVRSRKTAEENEQKARELKEAQSNIRKRRR
jgi:four helix bundle protein